MSKRHFAILLLLVLVAGVAAFWGFVLRRSAQGVIVDFEIVYHGARCLVEHCDPYNGSDVLHLYFAEGGRLATGANDRNVQQIVALQPYPPTSLLFFAPFALMNWGAAYVLWVALTLFFMILAAFLTWDLGQMYAPDLTFYLLCILLANCGILFAGGNPAGISVGLCVVSVWCFLTGRYTTVGVIAMAVSLAIKPHDAGPIWLFFILSRGVYRKRALQSLMLMCLLGIPALMWIWHISPHWMQEIRTTLVTYSAPGSVNDPGPNGTGTVSPGMMINLQTIVSLFRDDPGFYNPITYLLCAPFFIVLIVQAVRSRPSPEKICLGLAAVSAFSMLPLYHRPYDAKLLLLTIPACAMLWKQGGRTAWFALLVTGAGILITADIPLAILQTLNRGMHLSKSLLGTTLAIPLFRPVPLVLLVVGVFYLWAYAQRRDEAAVGELRPEIAQ